MTWSNVIGCCDIRRRIAATQPRPGRWRRGSWRRPRRLALRGADVLVNVLRQHVERDVAAQDHGVVECLEVVLRAERRPGSLALAVDLAVTDLVAARLP